MKHQNLPSQELPRQDVPGKSWLHLLHAPSVPPGSRPCPALMQEWGASPPRPAWDIRDLPADTTHERTVQLLRRQPQVRSERSLCGVGRMLWERINEKAPSCCAFSSLLHCELRVTLPRRGQLTAWCTELAVHLIPSFGPGKSIAVTLGSVCAKVQGFLSCLVSPGCHGPAPRQSGCCAFGAGCWVKEPSACPEVLTGEGH